MVLGHQEETVGLAPLMIRSSQRKGGLKLANLYPLSELYGTHSDLLIERSSKQYIDAFLKAIMEIQYKWDVFRMNRIAEDSDLMPTMEKYLKAENISYEIRKGEPTVGNRIKEL